MDTKKGLTLIEIADGVEVQDVVEATECLFAVNTTGKRVGKRWRL